MTSALICLKSADLEDSFKDKYIETSSLQARFKINQYSKPKHFFWTKDKTASSSSCSSLVLDQQVYNV